MKVEMIANHIHDALRQVEEMRALAIERSRFRGYSGIARIVGACAALTGAVCLFHPSVRFTNPWPMGAVFFVGELAGGLALWSGRSKEWTAPATEGGADDE